MSNRLWTIIGAFSVLLLPSTIYILRLDDVAGMMVDDGWYVMLARALAEGRGYWLVNAPFEHILPLYPPGFPGLLSLIFRAGTEFPDNVWVLKSVSMVAMLAVALLSYVYLNVDRNLPGPIAGLAASAIALTPALVFLATSTVMTECVFTLAQLGAVVLVHRAVGASSSARAMGLSVCASLAASGAMLTRSAGLAIVAAAFLFMVKERRWKCAGAFAVVAALCVLPWMVHARAHAPTPQQQDAHRGSIVYGYADQVWMRWAGAPMSGTISKVELLDRVGTNAFDVFGRSIAGIFVPTIFRGASESGEEVVALGGVVSFRSASMGGAAATAAISFLLSAVIVAGFVNKSRERMTVAEILTPLALAIILIWPFWTFRFVLPLTPFLMLYFVAGLQALTRLTSKLTGIAHGADSLRGVRITLLSIVGLHLFDHTGYLMAIHNPDRAASVSWLAEARDADRAMRWVKDNIPAEAVVASTNPGLLYLRTGRKTVTFDGSIAELLANQGEVRYVACFVPVQAPNAPELELVHTSPAGFWIMEIRRLQ